MCLLTTSSYLVGAAFFSIFQRASYLTLLHCLMLLIIVLFLLQIHLGYDLHLKCICNLLKYAKNYP